MVVGSVTALRSALAGEQQVVGRLEGSSEQQTKKGSTAMSIWDHLFLTGEFRAREDLLSGLTLEQVTLRPTGASHSIY